MLKRRNKIQGFQEGGANIDPVSGNEVPTGSLPEEVRDDVDAKLSPGEFVIPADVVRFIGLERLMKMRDEAKKGLQRMSDIGQMGNAEEVGEESNSTYEENDNFENEVDDILEEIESEQGDTNEQTEKMMAQGGFLKSGTDLTKAPKNPVFDVRYYKNDQGSVMYITHINGKPMTPIPEGFKVVSQEDAQKVGQAADEAKKAATPATGAVGAGGAASGQEGPGMGMENANASNIAALQSGNVSGLQTGVTVPTGLVQAAGVAGLALGIPGAFGLMTKGQQIANALTNMTGVQAGKTNIENMGKAFGLDTSTTEGKAAASSLIDSLSSTIGGTAATSGPTGTGGAAASAASTAGQSAAAAGHSNAAIGAAAQAAANAVIGGATPEEAAQAGQNAAVAVDASTINMSDIAESGAAGAGPSIGGIGDVSEGSGGASPFASGGLINRRQYPKKKTRGKGLAATK